MLHDVITTVVSLVLGALTGYYFHWRASRETRQQNVELKEDLKVLRESIYAVGRDEALHDKRDAGQGEDLERELKRWLLSYQGPDGTIPRTRVVQRFLDGGFTRSHIEGALTRLEESGIVAVGDRIEVR